MITKIFASWFILASRAFIPVSTEKCTTQWFDRDDPGGVGDYELLSDLLILYPGFICPIPIDIEAQTVSGISASNPFQVYSATQGLVCVNAAQAGGVCADYKVRFICPEEFCSSCRTPWIDRDDPGVVGDLETLNLIQMEYPLLVCPQPIAIEVTTLDGTQVQQTASIFQVFDPLQGFACVNGNPSCLDYRVRFTCPQSFCLPKCITQWFDRDDDTGNGDYEYLSDLLKEYPGLICPNPVGIEVQTVSGQPAFQTGNVFQVGVYNPTSGFACVNANQGGEQCADYRVRFLCPETLCSSCSTKWFNRDDPSGKGDYELLSDLLREYPGLICPDPIEIEAQTLSGQPASQTGDIFELYDPLKGFVCVNKQQKDRPCEDYMVRFICPPKFCKKLASIS